MIKRQSSNWNIKCGASIHKIYILFCSINTQSFFYDKSSSILWFINGKSRDPQKSLRHLSGNVTSTFKVGTGGWLASPSFQVLSGVFPTIFVL